MLRLYLVVRFFVSVVVRSFARNGRSIFLFIFDMLANFLRPTNSSSRAVLFVRVDNIGDFFLWLPYTKPLLNKYSTSKPAILICNQTCVDLAEAVGLFSQVIGIDLLRFNRDLIYRWRLVRQVAKLNVKIAIQPTFSREFLVGDSLIRASWAEKRIGSQGDLSNIRTWQKTISDRWYTKLVPVCSDSTMELGRNAEFLNGIGLQDAQINMPFIPKLMDLSPEKQVGKDYFVLFPGASSPIRKWPLGYFASVANHVVDQFGWTPIVCGGPEDVLLGDQLIKKLNVTNAINFAGLTTLPELTELLRGACLVISNETSAIHAAAAVGVPSVCVLGGGHYGRFMPYPHEVDGMKPVPVIHKMDCFGCNWHCKWSDDSSLPYPCVSGITVSQVITGVERALNQTTC